MVRQYTVRLQASFLITDCHVHIQPFELVLSPPALELMKKNQRDFDRVLEFTRSPKAFLKHMDQAGLDRAVLINAAAPDVTGFPAGLNGLAAKYAKEDPERLIPCGSLHPRHSRNTLADLEDAGYRTESAARDLPSRILRPGR